MFLGVEANDERRNIDNLLADTVEMLIRRMLMLSVGIYRI